MHKQSLTGEEGGKKERGTVVMSVEKSHSWTYCVTKQPGISYEPPSMMLAWVHRKILQCSVWVGTSAFLSTSLVGSSVSVC